jgi:serine protease Do
MTLSRLISRALTIIACTFWMMSSASGSADSNSSDGSAAQSTSSNSSSADDESVAGDAEAVADPNADATSEANDTEIIEPDLSQLELSNAARIRLDRARDSVVQIRGFYNNAISSAFHGSGFAVRDAGQTDELIVTNYHVVSEAVLFPRQYRLEYVAADGRTGKLQVYAIDVKNDLAIVKADDLRLPPLRLRTQIPSQGERAYSIGFPLNLGLTITEGVANGLVASSFEQRIHYTGAINGGMSGGPALDANGAVYGVNVSVVTGRQLVGLIVPAKHILPLLARAGEPLNRTNSPKQARQLVAAQVLAQQALVFASMRQKLGTQTLSGYTLPTQVSPETECSTVNTDTNPHLSIEKISCNVRARLSVQLGLEVGDINIRHRLLRAHNLHALQFTQQVNREAAAYLRYGSDKYVAPFACEDALVSLDGFDARVSTCARQYRLFADLYDLAVVVVSVSDAQQAIVSQLDLRGVALEPGAQFVRRYLGAMRWTP